ncbi:MAG: trypsin-like peptidase domain-containing protein [Clostridium perfringens]|nr:trypsin-like peptidase domain-containing protein [Clostridium perfringens]
MGNFNDEFKRNNTKKGIVKKSISFIAGGLVCAMLGGVSGGYGVYYMMKSDIEVSDDKSNSSLYSSTTTTNTSKEFATTGEALTIADVVKKVGPAVVGVDATINSTSGTGSSLGSGFIISDDGFVVTNYHVIEGATNINIILSNGEEVSAEVVNYDSTEDLAVLNIVDNIEMPGVAELGDSTSVETGEEVIAIGNPLGKEFSETVTSGIVSSANRTITKTDTSTVEYIQTDAAINSGNSGGPLINSAGQVIGINTAKEVGEGIEGIGFAIPINVLKEKLDSLSKPMLLLGITGRTIDSSTAKLRNLTEGVYIVTVSEYSAAEKAGLQSGDIITSFGGNKITSIDELNTYKQNYNEGDTVSMTVSRNGKAMNLQIVLEASTSVN